jgi:hypothetical protein
MLNWLVEEKGIAPHIPVFDKSKRDDGTFSRSDFRYDPTSDVYHCPGRKAARDELCGELSDESEESRKPGPHPCHSRIAPLAIFRLYRREFGQRNQDLPNALNDLLLLFGGELSETERLILYVHLARASKVNFVVRLNRDSGQ